MNIIKIIIFLAIAAVTYAILDSVWKPSEKLGQVIRSILMVILSGIVSLLVTWAASVIITWPDDPSGNGTESSSSINEADNDTDADNSIEAGKIYCATEYGKLTYLRWEYAPDKVIADREDGDYILVYFDYTNYLNQPLYVYNAFNINVFQDGEEVNQSSFYEGHVKELDVMADYQVKENETVTVAMMFNVSKSQIVEIRITDLFNYSANPLLTIETDLQTGKTYLHDQDGRPFINTSYGVLTYIGWNYAPEGLSADENVSDEDVLIANFEYTNTLNKPITLGDVFTCSAFQNGVKLNNLSSFYSVVPELNNRFDKKVNPGETITGAWEFCLNDRSNVVLKIKSYLDDYREDDLLPLEIYL